MIALNYIKWIFVVLFAMSVVFSFEDVILK